MGLKMAKIKYNLPRVLGTIIMLVLIGCLAKTWIWEQQYYKDKEGTERVPTSNSINTEFEEINEDNVDPNDISNYTVAPDRPRYLWIDKINVPKTRVLEVGIGRDGRLGTPSGIFDVGWYTFSGKPGEGGTILIDGHNGGPTRSGVFKNLPDLAIGDLITVERGDGQIFNYSIVESESVSLEDADNQMSKMQESPVPSRESLSLITCTGTWSQRQQTYMSRQFIRAVLAD